MKTLNLYAAIWDNASGPALEARHGMTSDGYQSTFDALLAKGYRLRTVSGYVVDGQDHYAAIWEHTSGAEWQARHRMTSDEYQKTFDQLVKAGYRLRTVSGYSLNGKDLYAALWDKEPTADWQARHRMTSDEYQKTFDQLVKQGYRLVWVDTYEYQGNDLYAAIWDKSAGPAWQARHRMTPSQYQATFDAMNRDGFRPVCLSACQTGNNEEFLAALWEKRAGSAWVAHHAMTSGGYQYMFDQLKSQGYQLRFVTGYAGAAPAIAVTSLKIERQLQSEWCWAATSVSVAHYYDANSPWTQCKMVNAQKGRSDCCQHGNSSACNQPGYLDQALDTCGHLSEWNEGKTSIGSMLSKLGVNNPVGIRVAWGGGGAHFIFAFGAELPNTVLVDDPIYGPSVLPYDTLANDYRGSGSWSHSYYTKP